MLCWMICAVLFWDKSVIDATDEDVATCVGDGSLIM